MMNASAVVTTFESGYGSTEKLWEESRRSRRTLLGVRSSSALLIVGCVVLLSVSALNLYLFLRPSREDHTKRVEMSNAMDFEENANFEFEIVLKDEWTLENSPREIPELQLPVENVIIMETGSETCYSKDACIDLIRFLQLKDIELRKKSDISYNFLVGGDGRIYEARGWNSVGDHTRDFDKTSIAIAFVGTYASYLPTTKQIRAVKELLSEGVKFEKLIFDYHLYCQNQINGRSNPGIGLYSVVKTWPHWSNDVVIPR